jgi:hypothetical protein
MKKITFILGILGIAFILRILGIGYGLPDLSHPDEARVILDTLSMGQRMSLLPERPDYALLYRYLLLFIFGLYFLMGKLIGIFKDTIDFALRFMINPAQVYLIARSISVVFGTAIGVASYLIGKKIFKKEEIGLVAMVFSLFEFQLLQHSQWAIYPIALCFFTLPVFYYIFKLIERPAKRYFLLSGLFCGLAISIQNQAIFIIPSLILAYILTFISHKKEIKPREFIRLVISSLFFLLIFSSLGNFYWFFIFEKSLAKTLELMGVTRVGFSSAAPYNYNFFSMLWWFINELIRQDKLLGIFLVSGIFYSIYKHTKYDLVFLTFTFFYLWIISSWGFRILHDVLSILPITCLFASRFLIEATERLIKNKYYYAVFSCIIVFPLISDSFKADIRKLHKDTRQIAATWIEQNIPTGSKIGIDWAIYSVPLKSNMPLLFRNPVATKYYNTRLPANLRQRYFEYLKTQKTYQLYEIMYATVEPLWPEDMPYSVIEKARKKYVYRDLYSRFHFKTLETLRKDKVQYIIITSFSWGFFLFDNAENKKNLFNPFIKDRPELNYRHTDHYINDNRHGILFYLVRRGRDFYQTFLNSKIDDARLIKEFQPSHNNFGPTIKIFELKSNGW